MSAGQLLADLGRRGIRLGLAADGIQYEGPRGALKPTDREAIAAHRAEIIELLRAEAENAVPDGSCGLCGGVLAFVEDWPSAGESRWLCIRCATWPAPSLAEVFQTVTAEEGQRLDVEAAQGDALAVLALRELRGDGRAA